MAIIEKRGNSYSIRVSAGYDTLGHQIRRNFTWTPEPRMTDRQIKKELQRQVVRLEDLVSTGRLIESPASFESFSERWMQLHAEAQLAPKTVFEYRRQLKRINQAIGHIRMDEIKPSHLIDFYNNLGEAGIREDTRFQARPKLMEVLERRGLSASALARLSGLGCTTVQGVVTGSRVSSKSAAAIANALNVAVGSLFSPITKADKLSGATITRYHRLISSILNTAVEWQVLVASPAARVRPPRADKKEPRFLDDIQARLLIEKLQGEPEQYRTMITLMIYTGLRRGEICGLKWTDLDQEKQLLHVRRAVQYLPGRGVFEKAPKSSSSIRVIRLSSIAVQLLKEHKRIQAADQLACGDQWISMDLMFTAWNGSYFNPNNLTQWFSGFVKRVGLPYVTPHSLRHTNATLMIAAGTDIRTVSMRLGHAQTSTTMNIYSHAIMSADEAAAEALGDILGSSKTTPVGAMK